MRAALLIAVFSLSFLVGFSQSDTARVDEWLSSNVADMGGRAMLVVYKDGKVVYSQSVRNMTQREKLVDRYVARRQGRTEDLGEFTSTSKQPIASCSKWLSAALVMTYVDEGKLNLDDTVGKWLPVLSQHGKGDITVRQCLSHLTGIQEPPLKESMKKIRDLRSMDEAIEWIAGLPMEGKPGTVFHYSNAGLQIAGAVVEKIGGASFEELFAKRVAGPLEMSNTDFGNKGVSLPAGGGNSTPHDYMNFLVMILNKGMFNGKRFLSEGSVAEMQVNRITPDVRIGYSPANFGGSPDASADGAGSDASGASADGGVRKWGYGYGEWMFGGIVSSPGLFGSFPWVNYKNGYCAFLLCFSLNNKGNQKRYAELVPLVDKYIVK